MIRKAVLFVTTLGATLCASAFVLSFQVAFSCIFTRQVSVGLDGGSLIVFRFHKPLGTVTWQCFVEQPLPPDKYPYVLLPSANLRRGARPNSVFLPLWIPFIIFAAYPTAVFIRGPLRRRRRRRNGLCLKCGYDLTGNESGTCPECGTPVSSPRSS